MQSRERERGATCDTELQFKNKQLIIIKTVQSQSEAVKINSSSVTSVLKIFPPGILDIHRDLSFHKTPRSDLNQEVRSPVRVLEIYGVTTTVMLSTVNRGPGDKILNIISPGFLIILAGAVELPLVLTSRIFNYLSKSFPLSVLQR